VDRSPVRLTLLLVALAACGGSKEKGTATAEGGGLGVRIAPGEAKALLPSADGAWLAWLDGCRVAKGQYLPAGTSNCDLRVAPSAGGEARRLAGAVSTLPHALAWSPAGASLAALAEYDYAAGAGTLVLWRDGAARELARDVTFHGWGPRGELGFISGGRLSVLLPGAEAPGAVEGAEGVASIEFTPAECPKGPGVAVDGPEVRIAARRSSSAGGQLLVADCAARRARPLGAWKVADYGFSRTGTVLAYTIAGKGGAELHRLGVVKGRADASLSSSAGGFSFAADGWTLAFLGEVAPGRQGNLYVAEATGAPTRVAKDVGDFRWATKAVRLAWLERYDPHVRSGVLGAGGPGIAPRTFGKNVTDFDLSPDGKRVAFLQHTARGGFSVDLGLAEVDGRAAPATVATGVFGFAFSPDGAWLYYRTRCARNGEGCDLERIPAAGLPKDGKPEPIAQGMKSFEFDPRDPSRLLVGWQRRDRPTLDVGVWQGGKLVAVDQNVLPGSARFLGPDSRRLGYAVVDPKRAGPHVATLP
jgi:hypothetical protein